MNHNIWRGYQAVREHTTQWGISCTPGGQERPKIAPLTLYGVGRPTPRSSESGFHRNVKFATFEEAGRLCKTIPQNGVKVAPLGGRRVLKFAPLTFYGESQLNITLDHSVIETRGWAHLTQTTNQHLRIIVKLSSHAPSNHLEHLSNTSHRLPLKEIKGISQDRSVIETWGWARLTRGSKQPILNHLNTHWPRPSNHCRAP